MILYNNYGYEKVQPSPKMEAAALTLSPEVEKLR